MKIQIALSGKSFTFIELAREVEALIPGISFQEQFETKPPMIYATMNGVQHRAVASRLRRGGYRVSAYQGPPGFRKDGRWYTTDRWFEGEHAGVRISPQLFVSDPDKKGVAYIFGSLVKYRTQKD